MIVGLRIREIRESKGLSQGDIEHRTGLIRCYTSRVENGHTVPSLETLEKFARALEVPMYRLFYDGEEPPKPLPVPKSRGKDDLWGNTGKQAHKLHRLRRVLAKLNDRDRGLLLSAAHLLVKRSG